MKPILHPFVAPLAVFTAIATLAGCQVPALNVTPGQASDLAKVAAQYASLGLKMLDDAGIETGIDASQISKLMVAGQEVEATYDADGNLQVPVTEAGGEQLVEVVLKDGQKVKVPVNAKRGEKLDAFLMSGYNEGELMAEVGARGAKPMDIFKDKTVLFEIGEAAITNENARAFFIGPFKTPRHSWFVENGNLRLHGSNLWVLMHAKGGPAAQQAGPMPGQQQQPMPGQQQPMPGTQQQPPQQPAPQPPMFNLAQLVQQPPPGGQVQQPMPGTQQQPPPGGMQQPMPGQQQPMPGMQQPMQGGQQQPSNVDRKVVLRLAAEMNGKFKVWAFTPKEGVRLPGPPPMPKAGEAPAFKDLPTLRKADFDIEVKEFATLEELDQAAEKKQGTFLPPPPPMRQMGPGGAPPPPQPR